MIELLVAVAILIWVIGPLARWQVRGEHDGKCPTQFERDDSAASYDCGSDPLANHPFYSEMRKGKRADTLKRR